MKKKCKKSKVKLYKKKNSIQRNVIWDNSSVIISYDMINCHNVIILLRGVRSVVGDGRDGRDVRAR